MTPHLLRTFGAVARHGNLTRAAEEMRCSQPAVSRQLQQLEREVGVPLVERVGRAMRLTDGGVALLEHATRLLGDLERAREAARAFASPERGTLRIGASTTPGHYLLPRVLGRFHRRHPDVALQVRVANSAQIEQALVRNALDLALVGGHGARPELRSEPLLLDAIVCFAAAAHPLARRRRLAPADLGGTIAVVREPGSATRTLFDAWAARHGLRLGATVELACPATAKALVAGGVGFAYGSLVGLADDLRAGRLRRLPVAGLALRRPISIVRHRDKAPAPVTEAFLALLRRTLGTDQAAMSRR